MALKVKKNVDEKNEKVLDEIEKISKEEKKKEDKNNKKDDKKKKNSKKDNKKDEKKPAVAKESWWHGVKSEFKKVRWPNRKEMIKYSIATISFILFFALFFYLIEVAIWLIKQA